MEFTCKLQLQKQQLQFAAQIPALTLPHNLRRNRQRVSVTARVVVEDEKSAATCVETTELDLRKPWLREIRTASETEPKQNDKKKILQSTNEMGMQDTALESTWEHRLWMTVGCGTLGLTLTRAVQEAAAASPDNSEWVVLALSGLLGYVLSDLGTGIYHWLVDNYGDSRTPIFGPQIDAFQGHHRRPWTITKRQFANNIHALARPAAFAVAPVLLLPQTPALAGIHGFLAVFVTCVVFSQQFHAWAHTKKKDLPPLVVNLQDAGVLVPRKMHGAHHRPPYSTNYCIVSGLWNPLLDRTNAFQLLERLIFRTYGVRPRSWTEAADAAAAGDWAQQGSYFSDGTDSDL